MFKEKYVRIFNEKLFEHLKQEVGKIEQQMVEKMNTLPKIVLYRYRIVAATNNCMFMGSVKVSCAGSK